MRELGLIRSALDVPLAGGPATDDARRWLGAADAFEQRVAPLLASPSERTQQIAPPSFVAAAEKAVMFSLVLPGIEHRCLTGLAGWPELTAATDIALRAVTHHSLGREDDDPEVEIS